MAKKQRKKPILKAQFNHKYTGSDGKKMDPTTQTQMDMAMSVKELYENHSRPVNWREGVYGLEVKNYRDITEVMEEKEEIKLKLDEANKKWQQLSEEKVKNDVNEVVNTGKEPPVNPNQLDIETEAQKAINDPANYNKPD